MFIRAQSELKTDGKARRGRGSVTARSRRRRCSHVRLDQSSVTNDRHVHEIMEVIADILVCVFDEAQQTPRIDPPTGVMCRTPKTAHTKELLAA